MAFVFPWFPLTGVVIWVAPTQAYITFGCNARLFEVFDGCIIIEHLRPVSRDGRAAHYAYRMFLAMVPHRDDEGNTAHAVSWRSYNLYRRVAQMDALSISQIPVNLFRP